MAIIALASPAVATSLADGLEKMRRFLAEAAEQRAAIVCFPEAYLPGLRGQDFDVLPFERADEDRVLQTVSKWTKTYRIAAIVGMERITDDGRHIASVVFDRDGERVGVQTKTQLDPTEDRFYVPGAGRQIFTIDDLTFGIAICHEGWRYPETVRWAAVRGAQIVFHPQHTGTERDGLRLTEWGSREAPYYEKAMVMRSIENAIYFASVNYALRFQESATTLIDPSGQCQAYLPYGQEGLLVQELDLSRATGHLARRFAPERYEDRP